MVLIVLCLIGALLLFIPMGRRTGSLLALASSLALFALATPAMSSVLMRLTEAGSPAHTDLTKAQAIIVLGGSVVLGNGRDIPDALGSVSLERVSYAAAAYRQLNLPVLVSGGTPRSGHQSEAQLMSAVLQQEFGTPVSWNEDRSRTTWENALFSAAILKPAGLTTVVLVSQAWHLPRAVWAFEKAGLTALPWPAPRAALHADSVGDFLPTLAALDDSLRALHELVGSAYYRLRYRATRYAGDHRW